MAGRRVWPSGRIQARGPIIKFSVQNEKIRISVAEPYCSESALKVPVEGD